MLNNRIIPCLLLKNQGLVKTLKFKEPKYIGDPINAVNIFNDKEVDELVFLDITATVERKGPSFKMLEEIASECFMPLGYGGGICSLEDMKQIFSLGVEKVIINSHAFENPGLIKEAADTFGSQSIVVSIDVKKSLFGKYEVYTRSGTYNTKIDPVTYARQMETMGAGEILLNSIDRDGMMTGYDIALLQKVAQALSVPLVACGGAGKIEHLAEAVTMGHASAVAAGSMFVFHGKHKAVLISYPTTAEISAILKDQEQVNAK